MGIVSLTNAQFKTSGLQGFLLGAAELENVAFARKSAMSSMKATLYDRVSGSVINSRSLQSVLNANGGTLDGSGNFGLTLTPVDNPIIDPTIVVAEVHVCCLNGPTKGGQRLVNRSLNRL
jgi:hypothetical protein